MTCTAYYWYLLLYNSIQSIYTKHVRLEDVESMRHSPFLENTLLQASPELTEAVAWAKTRIRVVEQLLCVKSKQKWKALNQSWNLYLYIYIYVILHTLSVVFSGWFPENDQNFGSNRDSSLWGILYHLSITLTLHTIHLSKWPQGSIQKSLEKSSKKPDHLACNLEHCEAGASEASWGDHWRLGWRCRLGSALAVGWTGQPLFSKTSRCHITKYS